MEWVTTSTILRDLRESGSGDAWERLVGRFHAPIIRFARRTGHTAAEAEDVAQETLAAFVKAYRTGKYDRRKGRLSHWLFGIAVRQSRRALRRGGRALAALRDLSTASGAGRAQRDEQASRLWEQEWEDAMLAECLRKVREEVEPQTFRVFEQVVLEGRAPADVAASLNLPATVVYNCKHRVIARLRKYRALLERVA